MICRKQCNRTKGTLYIVLELNTTAHNNSYFIIVIIRASLAQSFQRLATNWKTDGSEFESL
jgi:hypothetical protein